MINLLPPTYKKSVKQAKINIILVRYIVVVLITTLVVGGVMWFGIQATENNRKTIARSLAEDVQTAAELQPINEEAKNLADNIDLIATLLDQEIKFSELLREVGAVVPPGVVLDNLLLSEDKAEPLLLEVVGTSEAAIGVMLENLNESDLFVGGEISLVQRLNEPREGTDYQFTGSIKAFFAATAPAAVTSQEAAQ